MNDMEPTTKLIRRLQSRDGTLTDDDLAQLDGHGLELMAKGMEKTNEEFGAELMGRAIHLWKLCSDMRANKDRPGAHQGTSYGEELEGRA